MGKSLIIVESPTKAHKIQGFLDDSYIVMASKGHIADLAKGGKFGIGVDIDDNFKPRYVILDDKLETVNKLLETAKKCDKIYLAGDPDREGTAICWHISERLKDLEKPMKRIKISEIKKPLVLKAIKEAKDIDMNEFHAQEARRILDRIVGFMVSPYLMNKYKKTLSAGRVQSVLTKLIIDREEEINSFKPENYWTIQARFKKNNETFFAKYPTSLKDEKNADKIKAAIEKDDFYVHEVLADKENKYPPPPMVTSSLQRLMSKKYKLSADKTMKCAQSLYENGYCTYIRTDSTRCSEEALQDLKDYMKQNNLGFPKKPYVYKNKDSAQDAHECIRPSNLDLKPKDIADPDERKVYETIWKYFIASQMNPAVYSTLKITLKSKSNPSLEVKASGKALTSKGFLEILGIEDNSSIDIPTLTKGDVVSLSGKDPVLVEKKTTKPPARYSEDTLIKELEDNSIGRPATYADLLSKVTNRNYVELKGNVFHGTDLGKEITKVLEKYFGFMDYKYTANMEKILDDISLGKKDHKDMLKEFFKDFKPQLDKAYVDDGNTLCDKCNSPMVVRKSKNGDFLGCSKYPKCKNAKNLDKERN